MVFQHNRQNGNHDPCALHLLNANAIGTPGRMAGLVSSLSRWIANGMSAKDRFSGKRKAETYDLAAKLGT
ncbi:hypothetical protein ACIPEN_13330 [Herbaspirillum chlorophenolicum]|uniref:Uncharacterized protein n=1 Tax=Herbaspirillum chlorophenolicum TaxID=211589 RepID=A0ABW8F0L7_9BURK